MLTQIDKRLMGDIMVVELELEHPIIEQEAAEEPLTSQQKRECYQQCQQVQHHF